SVDDAVAVATKRELVSRQEIDRLRAQLLEFVTASLEHDYTVDHDCPEYANAAAEQAAALANVTEMHRLLGVRQERLFKAHDEIDRLRAENERLKIRIDAAAQVAFMAVRGFSADPPEVVFRMILSLLDGKHENARGVSESPEAGR